MKCNIENKYYRQFHNYFYDALIACMINYNNSYNYNYSNKLYMLTSYNNCNCSELCGYMMFVYYSLQYVPNLYQFLQNKLLFLSLSPTCRLHHILCSTREAILFPLVEGVYDGLKKVALHGASLPATKIRNHN